MMAPFYKYGLFGDNVSLIIAFAIGIAFGFVLERAGFGNARVLAAQFYFRDLRVLKVMFTAILTAMIGLYVLSRVGVVDLAQVYLTPTLVWPQIVGGLVLGAGFVIGGYCPGTSCVSAATGRVDGMVYVAGMFAGLLGFAEVYPRITGFAHTTALGQVTIPAYFHLPYGVVVLLVVVMALGAFVAAEWVERRFGGRQPDSGALLAPARGLTSVRALAVAAAAGGVFAAVAGNPYRGPFARIDARQFALDAAAGANRIAPETLARSIVEGRDAYVIVDLRDPPAFAAYHLPGAVNVPLASLGRDVASPGDRVVCYAETEAPAAEAALLLRAQGYHGAYALGGGLAAWREDVLFPAAPAAGASPTADAEFARRAAVARYFGGAPRDRAGATTGPAAPALPKVMPPVEPTRAPVPTRVRVKKEGC